MSETAKVVLYTALITLLCILGAHHVFAADISIRGGAAIENQQVTGGSKIFGLRYADDLLGGLRFAGEVGGYVDNLGNGRKGAALAKFQLGVSPGPVVGLYGSAFSGVCAISTSDTQLGSLYQFCTDFGIGVRDNKTFLGVTYSHISNAGLKLPNKGRDFLVLEMGVRF